jgi:hypothetical protein
MEPNGIRSFSTLAADKGGDLGDGGAKMPQIDLCDTVLEELRNTFTSSSWKGDAKETVSQWIAAFIPTAEQKIENTYDIAGTLCDLIKVVGQHCKANSEKVSAPSAVAKIVEAYQLGLVDTSTSGGSVVKAFNYFVANSSSITVDIGRARTAARTAAAVTTTQGVETSTTSEQEDVAPLSSQETSSSTEISTAVNTFALKVGWTPERVTTLMERSGLTEGDLDDIAFWASGTGKTDPNTGELIVRKNMPSYTDPDAILSLLEEGMPAKLVIVLVEMKRLLEGDAQVPELLDGAEMRDMTESDFIKKVLRGTTNLELDELAEFCDEFGFDLDAVVGHAEFGARTDYNEIIDQSVSEEIAEALLTTLNNGRGATLADKISSFVQASKSHHHIRGDFEAIAKLF